VAAFDFGCKQNILKRLNHYDYKVVRVPAQTSFEEIQKLKVDGVFLSNGPGDPAAVGYVIPVIQKIMETGKPIFGICLGHQLMALAYGAKTYKLKFGHRGGNQPVMDLTTGKVEITSQNHGFAVDETSLPGDVRVTHINLNDKTNEGLAHQSKPFFSVQYHPEASPGPHDSDYLFPRFVGLMETVRKK
jgi:carbamoyl-phosphate synthase small subunit